MKQNPKHNMHDSVTQGDVEEGIVLFYRTLVVTSILIGRCDNICERRVIMTRLIVHTS